MDAASVPAMPPLPVSPLAALVHDSASAGGGATMNERDAWCDSARAFIQRWTTLAQIHLAMNTLAALAYGRAYKLALSVVTILTVLVGSKGVATLISGSTAPMDIVGGIAEVLLGITAGLLTNFELKAKSEAFSRRASGYGRLAATLQAKTLIHDAQDRAHLTTLILSITEDVQVCATHVLMLPRPQFDPVVTFNNYFQNTTHV